MLFFLIKIVQIVLSLPVSLNQNKERTYAATNSISASKLSKQLPYSLPHNHDPPQPPRQPEPKQRAHIHSNKQHQRIKTQ